MEIEENFARISTKKGLGVELIFFWSKLMQEGAMTSFYVIGTITQCRARRDERVEPCLYQHVGRRRSTSSRVYKFSPFLLWLYISLRNNIWKSEVDMSTPIHAVATPLNTCRASRACRACRDERVAPCVRQARHVSIPHVSRHDFSLCQNACAR